MSAAASTAAARGATAGRATARRSSAPRPVVARIRWDRIGRMAMLFVLVAIAYLYLSAGLSLFSTWRESKRDHAQVVALEQQEHALARQRAALTGKDALQIEARKLGMIRPGELGFYVSGLPSD